MPPIFTCAAALNPKIGLDGVENILEDIEGYLGLDSDYAKVSMTKCCDTLHEVFDYYDKMHRSKSRERNMTKESGSRNIVMESVLRRKSRSLTILNELELYKNTDFINVMSYDEYENCNMLEWWRNKGRYQYPVMGEMVRDMITVQASTMGLEFGFCLHGRVLDELTTWKLKPRWEEMRMFLKEHYDDNEGKENVDLIEDDDDDDDDDGSEDVENFLIDRIKEEVFGSDCEDYD
ncbi:unnamed protein product [Lactuca virosa]|uniref:HAT C-terminal dimerisation domain-containing protein n=1 Tax=Lactuca virosa TaxID=75947 RepID=A0AAU9PC02_9ASTR|nr:unnamed protein product [Lactuca virosa]